MAINHKKIKVPMVKVVRLFFLLFLFFGVFMGGITSLFYHSQFKSIIHSLENQKTHTVNIQKKEIEKNLYDVISDLFFLSTQNELQEYFDSPKKGSYLDVEKEYKRLFIRKKKYDQISYIDKTGQEIVCVKYNMGSPVAIKKAKLQNKLQQDYVQKTLQLKQGEIYISPLGLDREDRNIEASFKPMLHFGTPVFNTAGSKQGAICINYLAQEFLDSLKKDSNVSPGRSMLLDNKGYWLLHDDSGKEVKSTKGQEKLDFAGSYPEEWQEILQQKTGQFQTARGLFTFTIVYPLQQGLHTRSVSKDAVQDFWVLVSYISPLVLKKYVEPFQFRVFLLGLGLFAFVTLGAWLMAYSITKRRMYQKHLLTMALYDALTSLPNRKHFFEKLEAGISHAQRYGNKLGLLYIDLDGFKAVNDTFGHEFGDELLLQVSKRMLLVTRKTDTVARLGGDEFAVILFQVDSMKGVLAAGKKLIQAINEPVQLGCGTVIVGASVGGVLYPDAVRTPEELVKLADQAMYISKSKGKNMCTLSDAIQKQKEMTNV